MAENEYLDIAKSIRWQRWLAALLEGAPLDELVRDFERRFAGGIRNFQRLISKHGNSLAKLLHAVQQGPKALAACIAKCRDGREYAELLNLTPATATSKQAIAKSWVDNIANRLLDQVAVRAALGAVPSSRFPDLLQLSSFIDDLRSRVAPEMQRVARRIAKDPNQLVTRKPQPRGSDKDETTKRTLGMSLLSAARGNNGKAK